jgi:hypothetical protein
VPSRWSTCGWSGTSRIARSQRVTAIPLPDDHLPSNHRALPPDVSQEPSAG